MQLLQSVTVAANRSSSIEHTARTCLGLICSYSGWPLGHAFLQVNDSSEDLISTGIWHTKGDSPIRRAPRNDRPLQRLHTEWPARSHFGFPKA